MGSTHSFFWSPKSLDDATNAHEAVLAAAGRVAVDRGLEVVEVQLNAGRRGGLVRVFVDRPGGVGVDELSAVSQELSVILDAEDPIQGAYTLEVSSPGLDRPLRSEADFRRVVGRRVTVERAHESPLVGRVVGADPESLTLESEPGLAPLVIPYADVTRARLAVELPHGRPRPEKTRKHKKKTRKSHG